MRKSVERLLEHTNYALSPRAVHIDFTWNCNLKCTICARKNAVMENRNLTLEQFKQLTAHFPRLRRINIVGWGEPLMNPEFLDIMSFAAAKGVSAVFTTNGMLLSEDMITKLPRNISSVFFSIDSPKPDIYQQLRPGARFEKVKAHILKLRSLRPDINAVIQMVLLKENVRDVGRLVAFASEVGAHSIHLINLAAFTQEDDKRHLHFIEDDISGLLKSAHEEAARQKVKLYSPPLKPQSRPCKLPWTEPYITLDGVIYPCGFSYRGFGVVGEWYAGIPLEFPVGQFQLGNIYQDSFDKIWNGKGFRLLRSTLRSCSTDAETSVKDMAEMRKNADILPRFSYCRICLWRWNCAC